MSCCELAKKEKEKKRTVIKRKKEKIEDFFGGQKTKGNIRNFVRWKTQN